MNPCLSARPGEGEQEENRRGYRPVWQRAKQAKIGGADFVLAGGVRAEPSHPDQTKRIFCGEIICSGCSLAFRARTHKSSSVSAAGNLLQSVSLPGYKSGRNGSSTSSSSVGVWQLATTSSLPTTSPSFNSRQFGCGYVLMSKLMCFAWPTTGHAKESRRSVHRLREAFRVGSGLGRFRGCCEYRA
jgi:hypothetical protein